MPEWKEFLVACVALVFLIQLFRAFRIVHRSVHEGNRHRDSMAARRLEIESRERELALLPSIISAYAGVVGDPSKADELSAIVRGMVGVNFQPPRDTELHAKIDQLEARLKRWEAEADNESPQQVIERERTERVRLLLQHLEVRSAPVTATEMNVLLQTAQGEVVMNDPPGTSNDSSPN